MALVVVFSQIKLLFGPLVIQLVWYILNQLFTSVSVKVVEIILAATTIHLHFGVNYRLFCRGCRMDKTMSSQSYY